MNIHRLASACSEALRYVAMESFWLNRFYR